MSEKYTYADVIIDPDDPRVEIGKEYYFGDGPSHLLWGVRTGWEARTLVKVCKDAPSEDPFYNGSARFQCIIRKKEPKKKYVPFDLSNPEDRKALMGKTIKANNQPFSRQYVELVISCFELVDKGAEGVSGYWMANGIKEDELFHDWTFLDGSPCGKEMEE